jgi:phosphoribosyl-ATP pyrophosphohydrolase
MVEEATELALKQFAPTGGCAAGGADLVYNMIVLLEGMDISFDDVCRELDRRRGAYGIAAKLPKAGLSLAGHIPVK